MPTTLAQPMCKAAKLVCRYTPPCEQELSPLVMILVELATFAFPIAGYLQKDPEYFDDPSLDFACGRAKPPTTSFVSANGPFVTVTLSQSRRRARRRRCRASSLDVTGGVYSWHMSARRSSPGASRRARRVAAVALP